jgi:hypothetical protein
MAKFRVVISGRVKDGQVDAFVDLARRATPFV